MLMDKENAELVVKDLELVKTVSSNEYGGSLYDIRLYNGNLGLGYTVVHKKEKKYYLNTENIINKRIYKGDYSVKDAVMASNCALKTIFHTVFGDFVNVTPTWELQLNCKDGRYVYKKTEEYKPITIAGSILTVCWVGPISEKKLRYKIRRKMKSMINSGKAKLI